MTSKHRKPRTITQIDSGIQIPGSTMFAPTVTMDKIGTLSRLPGSKSRTVIFRVSPIFLGVVSSQVMTRQTPNPTPISDLENLQPTKNPPHFFQVIQLALHPEPKNGEISQPTNSAKNFTPPQKSPRLTNDETGRSWCCSHQKLGCIKPKEFECTEAEKRLEQRIEGERKLGWVFTWNLCWLKLDCWGPSLDFGGCFFVFLFYVLVVEGQG